MDKQGKQLKRKKIIKQKTGARTTKETAGIKTEIENGGLDLETGVTEEGHGHQIEADHLSAVLVQALVAVVILHLQ